MDLSEIKKKVFEIYNKYNRNFLKVLGSISNSLENRQLKQDILLINKDFSLSESLYHILKDGDFKKKICPTCNENELSFINFTVGYRQFCSVRCFGNNVDIKNKIQQTNLQKYGVDNPFKSLLIKDKIKQTNLQRYGV